jgi:hypothetical protein
VIFIIYVGGYRGDGLLFASSELPAPSVSSGHLAVGGGVVFGAHPAIEFGKWAKATGVGDAVANLAVAGGAGFACAIQGRDVGLSFQSVT